MKPKYFKKEYPLGGEYLKSYKDVPGWLNGAESVYEEMVNQAKDGAHFVEIGVLLGQSTTRMAELIKASGKKIKFDAIDLFWLIGHTLQYYEQIGHPKEFYNYYVQLLRLGHFSYFYENQVKN